jgi:16S rRNA (guanine1516-N2)-methyltransferase
VDDGDGAKEARQLAQRLSLPLVSRLAAADESWQFTLSCQPQGLCLSLAGERQPGPLIVDFTAPALVHRVHDRLGQQALIRAVGCKPGLRPTVLDGTAGLGRDAYLLARAGCEVTLLEQDPVIHALLADGLARAAMVSDPQVRESVQRMQLRLGDFLTLASRLPAADVIYLDPMFPKRSKSAQVKKDLFMLQQYFASAAAAASGEAMLDLALQLARRRVVVKRPRLAAPLADRQPSHTLAGSSSRLDVYIIP